MTNPLLKVEDVRKYFPVFGGMFRRTIGQVKALDGVSFTLNQGETLGVVGESGCGKSTLGRSILKLHELTQGRILYRDQDEEIDIAKLEPKERLAMCRKIQMVFQDPYSALNPVKTVFQAFDEPLKRHGMLERGKRVDYIEKLFETVNLNPDFLKRFPHEFSGGQRQRICIARALSLSPRLIVLDEPVSALDVSIQAQVLNLLLDIQKREHVSYIFIAHDLSVVEYMSDRIAVMYLGKIVEMADAKVLYRNKLHPYTQALLSAVPIPALDVKREQIVLSGDVPSPANPPSGCAFHPRCRYYRDRCKRETPLLKDLGGGHLVACHYPLTEGE